MTLPIERTHAVLRTEQFLKDLLNPRATPRVPREVREQAYRCLKHYPGNYDMELASEKAPDVFGDNK